MNTHRILNSCGDQLKGKTKNIREQHCDNYLVEFMWRQALQINDPFVKILTKIFDLL